MPDRAAMHPISTQGDDIADLATLNAFDGFNVAGLVTALGAVRDSETLLLGKLGSLIHQSATRTIDGDRLFHEDVLAGFNTGLEMPCAKTRRRRKDGVVDAGRGQNLLIRVEATEAFICRQIKRRLGCLVGLFRE